MVQCTNEFTHSFIIICYKERKSIVKERFLQFFITVLTFINYPIFKYQLISNIIIDIKGICGDLFRGVSFCWDFGPVEFLLSKIFLRNPL